MYSRDEDDVPRSAFSPLSHHSSSSAINAHLVHADMKMKRCMDGTCPTFFPPSLSPQGHHTFSPPPTTILRPLIMAFSSSSCCSLPFFVCSPPHPPLDASQGGDALDSPRYYYKKITEGIKGQPSYKTKTNKEGEGSILAYAFSPSRPK